ncbi:hypothetical protein GN956_G24358 [Arapaima gigas]
MDQVLVGTKLFRTTKYAPAPDPRRPPPATAEQVTTVVTSMVTCIVLLAGRPSSTPLCNVQQAHRWASHVPRSLITRPLSYCCIHRADDKRTCCTNRSAGRLGPQT